MPNKLEEQSLYMPIEWWAPIIKVLDNKLKELCTGYGYGKAGVEFLVRYRKVLDCIFMEEVTVRRKDVKEQRT